jgi:hypothetical protein
VLAIELQLQALRSPGFAATYNEPNRKHRRALGGFVTALFELFGKAVPGEPAEIAASFIALGLGLALLSADVEARRSGQIMMTFLKALIASAPLAAGTPSSTPKPASRTKSPGKRS